MEEHYVLYAIVEWANKYTVTRWVVLCIMLVLAVYNYGWPLIFFIEGIKNRRFFMSVLGAMAIVVFYVTPLTYLVCHMPK